MYMCNSSTWNLLRWLAPLSCDVFILRVLSPRMQSYSHSIELRSCWTFLTLFNSQLACFTDSLLLFSPRAYFLCFLYLPLSLLKIPDISCLSRWTPITYCPNFQTGCSGSPAGAGVWRGETCLRNSGSFVWNAATLLCCCQISWSPPCCRECQPVT